MVDRATFVKGLGVIALQLNQPATEDKLNAFFLALEDETDAREWQRFVKVAARRFGWKFLPSVPELLEALREFRGAPRLDSEAVAAYERVIAARQYNAEGGASWTYRGVLEACGRAAADAFQAAGGSAAFERTWDEAKRQERFCAAYREVAAAAPNARLLPFTPKAELPAPVHAGDVSRESASDALKVIRKTLGIPEGAPKSRDPFIAKATDERLAELKRQAAALIAEEQAVKVGVE